MVNLGGDRNIGSSFEGRMELLFTDAPHRKSTRKAPRTLSPANCSARCSKQSSPRVRAAIVRRRGRGPSKRGERAAIAYSGKSVRDPHVRIDDRLQVRTDVLQTQKSAEAARREISPRERPMEGARPATRHSFPTKFGSTKLVIVDRQPPWRLRSVKSRAHSRRGVGRARVRAGDRAEPRRPHCCSGDTRNV